MLYLIGGAPRVGKSIIARQLMKEKSMPWFSTDALRSVLFEIAPKASRDALFPYAGTSDNDTVFEEPINIIVEQQITEARSMKVGIHALMEFQISVHDDFILEGVHILPEHVYEFFEKFPEMQKHVRVLFVIDADIENALRGLQGNTSHFDWLKDAQPTTLLAVAEFVVKFSEYINREAVKYHMQVYYKTVNFTADIKNCMGLL